jgi:putative ABC transport system permease protein
MLHNFFILAIRNLSKRRQYAAINVLGVSIGVAVCLVILRYVEFELSYDRHHTNGPYIYRTILTRYLNGEFRDILPATGYGTGPALMADIPEIENVARVHPAFGGAVMSSAEKNNPLQFREDRSYLVDPSFLEIFSFKVVTGDLKTALNHPKSVVVTRSIALKYFGHLDVLGETLRVTAGWTESYFTISAIIEDQPQNSDLTFDFLFPLHDLLQDKFYQEDDGWGWKNFTTYVQLHPHANVEVVTAKLPQFISKYQKGKQDISFQPLYDIHTQTGLAFDSSDRVSRDKIYFYILIAIFILCIAWINYINLATARATERGREVGIKKVLGAQKKQLILQFLFESAIINSVAVSIAVILGRAMLPVFSSIVGKNLAFDFYDARLWLLLGGLAFIGSLVSGLYPAFVLSSFRVIAVLKGGGDKISNTFSLRKVLVVFQFACSLILICLTLVIIVRLPLWKVRSRD